MEQSGIELSWECMQLLRVTKTDKWTKVKIPSIVKIEESKNWGIG